MVPMEGKAVGLDQADARVIPPDVGRGFGYKRVLHPEVNSVSWAAISDMPSQAPGFSTR